MNQEDRLISILQAHQWFMDALKAVEMLELRQWYIGGGALRNIVFDHLAGGGHTPIRDVDVAYFQPEDLSREGDRRYESILSRNMPFVPWEVTNQAGVHLWFHEKFGYRVPPFQNVEEAISTWPETCTAVGITRTKTGEYKVFAPYGLGDLFGFCVRRNPKRIDAQTYNLRITSKRYDLQWTSVKIIHDNYTLKYFEWEFPEPDITFFTSSA